MIESLSSSSGTSNVTFDQDLHSKYESFKANPPSFAELIADYNLIHEEINNQIKKLVESRLDNPPQLNVPDIKTSEAFREILKKHNLSEHEWLDLLKKAEEKLQELKHIKA
ncbi:MAG TPA: hypothetical protein VHK67_07435 [Rhabdochlamydiaceae bacterium]|jgi:intergrase/recombinase|nr:hypothetical protein [Rhabdochlamydiaceae bacterium]